MTKTKIPIIVMALFSMLLLPNIFSSVYAEGEVYQVAAGASASISLSSDTVDSSVAGEIINANSALIGVEINKIEILITRDGSFTETELNTLVYVGIWDSTITPTSSNMRLSISTFQLEELVIKSGATSTTFNFDTYTIQEGDVIGIGYFDALGTQKFIEIHYNNAESFDSTNTGIRDFLNDGTGWRTVDASADIIGIFYTPIASAEVCIDTNLNGVVDLCFTDTNNDGVADNGQGGALGAFQSNANVTQMGQTWFCSFNIGDACNNNNAQTNGVGIFYLALMILFSYAILVSIHLMAIKASGNNVGGTQALMIHPILLLVMLFVDVGFAWYLNFIEDTIFYSVLVLMVGLGGFGLYKVVTRN